MTTPPAPLPQPGGSADLTEIGARVLKGRDDLRLNQQDFADKAGLSRAYISRLERGLIPNPTITDLGKVADALGISLAALTAARPQLEELRFSHEWAEIQRQTESLPPHLRDQIRRIAQQSIDIALGASDLARRN